MPLVPLLVLDPAKADDSGENGQGLQTDLKVEQKKEKDSEGIAVEGEGGDPLSSLYFCMMPLYLII